jgi:hypothetical protein
LFYVILLFSFFLFALVPQPHFNASVWTDIQTRPVLRVTTYFNNSDISCASVFPNSWSNPGEKNQIKNNKM